MRPRPPHPPPHSLRRSSRKVKLGAALGGLALLTPLAVAPSVSAATETADEAGPRQQVYTDAAAEFGVPESVLLGVSYLESRWDTNSGLPSVSAGYGPMHLTDAEYVADRATSEHHTDSEDPRGDESRPLELPQDPGSGQAPNQAALQTLDDAAELTGSSEKALRTDVEANIRGGAALLAEYQAKLEAPAGVDSDPADWYGAVAKYSGADSADTAKVFADEVYKEMTAGTSRTTDDGHTVALVADAGLSPNRDWLDALGLPSLAGKNEADCPRSLPCDWLPAPYELRGDGTNKYSYGNHDLGNRPESQKIEYIVIHDAEGYYDTLIRLAQDKNWVSWQYSLRSSDGQIANHLKAKDVGWHAGNWFVNAKAIGLEHEGFAAGLGAWYTEAMYRTSAKLVRHLAEKYDVPLDRQHIIGHDNVPGILPDFVRGMHWDPGPYWDWSHYFDLLDAPFRGIPFPKGGLVTIDPDFESNEILFTECENSPPDDDPCVPHSASAVMLRTAPDDDAPLVEDIGLHPGGGPSSMAVWDHGARASSGQTYAVADRQGDWTAIWYLGQKAWFHNPRSAPTGKWTIGLVATPKPGKDTIPVYGRAYPDAEAYPEGVPPQDVVPLQYTFSAGERYAVGDVLNGEYYRARTYDWSDPGDGTVIRGDNKYVQIQFGHRVMFVNFDDVNLVPSVIR